MYIQQGDVLLHRCDALPEGAQESGRYPIVLAQGEATGHAHVIVDTECRAYTLADALFIKCDRPVQVAHEEHNAVVLEPGVWRVAIVREYDHFAEEARRVAD